MPETDAPTNTGFSESAITARWANTDFASKDVIPEPANDLTETPKVETPEIKETKAEAKANESDIPDEVLGIEKPKEQEEDILETLPKGQIKHEHFKKVQDKAKADIAATKAEMQAILKERDELKSKYTDDYIPEKIKKEYEALRARHDEIEAEYKRTNVQQSKEFKERFTSKQESLSSLINKTGKDMEIPQYKLDSLLRAQGKERFELLEDLDVNSSAKSYLVSLFQQHDQIESDKSAFMENWKENAERMEQERIIEADKHKASVKEHEDRIFEKEWDDAVKKFGPLAEIPGNDKWNQGIKEIKARAKEVFDGDFTPDVVSRLAIGGLALERMNGMFELARSKVQSLSKELAELKAAAPSAGHVGNKVPQKDYSKMTQTERFEHTYNEMVGSARNQA